MNIIIGKTFVVEDVKGNKEVLLNFLILASIKNLNKMLLYKIDHTLTGTNFTHKNCILSDGYTITFLNVISIKILYLF